MKAINRLRVLYAEDDQDACVMLSVMLGVFNIEICPAHTAKEAFRLAREEEFDLYLLSSRFSDGSGYELCRRLRTMNPQKPIVFYSGDAYESDRQEGFAAGADEYLVKPHSEAIAATIFQLLEVNHRQYYSLKNENSTL